MNNIINLKELNFDKYQSYSNKDPNDHDIDTTNFSYHLTHDFHKLHNKNSNKTNNTFIQHMLKQHLHTTYASNNTFIQHMLKQHLQSFIQTYALYKVILIILNNFLITLNMNLILLPLQKPGTHKETKTLSLAY